VVVCLVVPFSSKIQRSQQHIRAIKMSTLSLPPPSKSTTVPKRIHLNHAGSSPSPQRVTDRIRQHLQLEQELGGYAAQDVVSRELDQVYVDVAQLIHAQSPMEIALVESATVGWTRAFYAMVQEEESRLQQDQSDNDGNIKRVSRVILVSEVEYAANIVAACQWAREHRMNNWMVLVIPSSKTGSGTSTGIVDIQILDKMLSGRYQHLSKTGELVALDPISISMICITHVPTNSGIINPVETIGDLVAVHNQRRKHISGPTAPCIRYLVDACQSVGQLDVNVQKIKCHALVATGRKYLRGPRGTGFLFIAKNLLEKDCLIPSHIDHFGCPVSSVPLPTAYLDGVQLQLDSVIQFTPLPSAKRFEFWESNIANRLGLGEAVRYALEVGQPRMEHRILQLSTHLRNNLSKIAGIYIHHKETTKCGIVTFHCENIEPKVLQALMMEDGFELSVVPATSSPMDSSKTQVPDLVRASLTYINTEEEIFAFSSRLSSVVEQRKG
jgi:cysteine desulfurase / selenocysteine lyase